MQYVLVFKGSEKEITLQINCLEILRTVLLVQQYVSIKLQPVSVKLYCVMNGGSSH